MKHFILGVYFFVRTRIVSVFYWCRDITFDRLGVNECDAVKNSALSAMYKSRSWCNNSPNRGYICKKYFKSLTWRHIMRPNQTFKDDL